MIKKIKIYDLEYYFDKFLMLLVMLGFTIILPLLFIGFIIKWALIDCISSSKFFYTRIKKVYIVAYEAYIK